MFGGRVAKQIIRFRDLNLGNIKRMLGAGRSIIDIVAATEREHLVLVKIET